MTTFEKLVEDMRRAQDKAKKTRAYLDARAAESLENAVDADLRAIKKAEKTQQPAAYSADLFGIGALEGL